MLETLTQGFKNAKLKLAGKTRLTEDNISEALTDVRLEPAGGPTLAPVSSDFPRPGP